MICPELPLPWKAPKQKEMCSSQVKYTGNILGVASPISSSVRSFNTIFRQHQKTNSGQLLHILKKFLHQTVPADEANSARVCAAPSLNKQERI